MLIYVLVNLARLILLALQLAFFIRAILSWFPIENEGTFVNLLYAITEPVIQPVRSIIERFHFMDSFPFDMSFLITFILLSVVYQMLRFV